MSFAEFLRQRDWIQGHFNRLEWNVAHYNHDNPSQVNEARFISNLRDIDKFNTYVGVAYGWVVAGALMRKFNIREAMPVYCLLGWVGSLGNRYRHHDVMYAALLRVVTKDPNQPI